MSLDRLIDLAKKTGDRLIIHDPLQGRDLVLMDIDSYEQLHEVRNGQRKNLSERQLLDQINRDIALWRAHQEMEGDTGLENDEFAAEEEALEEIDAFGTYAAGPSPWHSTRNILATHSPVPVKDDGDELPVKSTKLFDGDERTQQIPSGGNPAVPVSEMDAPVSIPYRENNAAGDWEEEPIPGTDEPVFYEEPV